MTKENFEARLRNYFSNKEKVKEHMAGLFCSYIPAQIPSAFISYLMFAPDIKTSLAFHGANTLVRAVVSGILYKKTGSWWFGSMIMPLETIFGGSAWGIGTLTYRGDNRLKDKN